MLHLLSLRKMQSCRHMSSILISLTAAVSTSMHAENALQLRWKSSQLILFRSSMFCLVSSLARGLLRSSCRFMLPALFSHGRLQLWFKKSPRFILSCITEAHQGSSFGCD